GGFINARMELTPADPATATTMDDMFGLFYNNLNTSNDNKVIRSIYTGCTDGLIDYDELIDSSTSGACYLNSNYAPYRTRLNTLFATDLVARANQ
ncbi:hypothetical protein, partial [Zooshikella sp. RANM57]|uniref:hypothetical protein n=1 Tax=Zooshikella sp. RANM57 TaxID=3425863 RepID=UPI003D6E8BED